MDNGIYVLYVETEKGPEYRVTYAHAIDSIYGKFDNETFKYEGDLNIIKSTFANAMVFSTLDAALDYAESISYDYDYLEDGISVIKDFSNLGHLFEDEEHGRNQDLRPPEEG